MTSAFSWQNSISLCPASFCTPRPNLPVTPGVSWLPTFAFQSPITKRTSFLGVSSKRSCRSSRSGISSTIKNPILCLIQGALLTQKIGVKTGRLCQARLGLSRKALSKTKKGSFDESRMQFTAKLFTNKPQAWTHRTGFNMYRVRITGDIVTYA